MPTRNNGKQAVKAALERSVKAFLVRRKVSDIMFRNKTLWVRGDVGFMPKELREASWSVRSKFDMFATAEWQALEAAASSWTSLARHLGMVMHSDAGSENRFELRRAVEPMMPQPSWNSGSDSFELPAFDSAEFDAHFDRLASYLESDVVTYTTKTILVGLQVDESVLPLRLSDEVVIAALSADEIEHFGALDLITIPYGNPKTLFEWPGHPWVAVITNHVSTKHLSQEPFHGDEDDRNRERFDRVHNAVLQALVLLRYGVVSLGGSLSQDSIWDPRQFSIRYPKTQTPSMFSLTKRFMHLDARDVEALPELFRKICGRFGLKRDAVDMALRRLTSAMENDSPEDRLLDDMIAAEAILSDGSAEISYRLCLRLAFVVEPDNPICRKQAFKIAKQAYAFRSAIVHGKDFAKPLDDLNGQRVSHADFVQEVENLVRFAVRKAVMDEGCFAPDKWDDIILSGDLNPSIQKSSPSART